MAHSATDVTWPDLPSPRRVTLIARGLAYGALGGVVVGIAVVITVAVIALQPSLVVIAPFAVVYGGVFGAVDGLLAGVFMAVTMTAGQTRRQLRFAGAEGAAIPPLVLVFATIGASRGYSWVPFVVLTWMSAVAGAVLGPVVVGHGGAEIPKVDLK